MKRKITLMVGMATLCAVLLTGCSGSDPSDSVMELVKNGDIEQAQQIYAEKISGKEEYESSFAEKFIPYGHTLTGWVEHTIYRRWCYTGTGR